MIVRRADVDAYAAARDRSRQAGVLLEPLRAGRLDVVDGDTVLAEGGAHPEHARARRGRGLARASRHAALGTAAAQGAWLAVSPLGTAFCRTHP